MLLSKTFFSWVRAEIKGVPIFQKLKGFKPTLSRNLQEFLKRFQKDSKFPIIETVCIPKALHRNTHAIEYDYVFVLKLFEVLFMQCMISYYNFEVYDLSINSNLY